MFEVGDRRMPSTPGWAGERKRRSAVLVMANGNPVPRVRRGKEAAVGEGFPAPSAQTAKGRGIRSATGGCNIAGQRRSLAIVLGAACGNGKGTGRITSLFICDG